MNLQQQNSDSQNKQKGVSILKDKLENDVSQQPPPQTSNNPERSNPTEIKKAEESKPKENAKKYGFIDSLLRALIRPPSRITYTPSKLGPINFLVDGKVVAKREDFQVRNSRGQNLECSYFEALAVSGKKHPCVLYLHGNSSSRNEGIILIQYLIPYGISLVLMDFAGCGISEGEYISLGYFEKFDAKLVMDYVKKEKPITEFGLWGRSMGAATTLMTALKEDDTIRYIVMDSSFTSIKNLCKDIATVQYYYPRILFPSAFNYVQRRIQKMAEFDLNECDALKAVITAKQKPSALFLTAVSDTLIPNSHSQLLFDSYRGQKRILSFEGTHNSRRPKDINQEICSFFFNGLFDDYGINKLGAYKMIQALPDFHKSEVPKATQTVIKPQQNKSDMLSQKGKHQQEKKAEHIAIANKSNQISINSFSGGPNLIKQNNMINISQIKPKENIDKDDVFPEDEPEEENLETNKNENVKPQLTTFPQPFKGTEQSVPLDSYAQMPASSRQGKEKVDSSKQIDSQREKNELTSRKLNQEKDGIAKEVKKSKERRASERNQNDDQFDIPSKIKVNTEQDCRGSSKTFHPKNIIFAEELNHQEVMTNNLVQENFKEISTQRNFAATAAPSNIAQSSADVKSEENKNQVQEDKGQQKQRIQFKEIDLSMLQKDGKLSNNQQIEIDLEKLESEESKAMSVNNQGNYVSSAYPPNLNTEGVFDASPRQPKSQNPSSVMNNNSIIASPENKEIKEEEDTQFNSKIDRVDIENNQNIGLSGFFIPQEHPLSSRQNTLTNENQPSVGVNSAYNPSPHYRQSSIEMKTNNNEVNVSQNPPSSGTIPNTNINNNQTNIGASIQIVNPSKFSIHRSLPNNAEIL